MYNGFPGGLFKAGTPVYVDTAAIWRDEGCFKEEGHTEVLLKPIRVRGDQGLQKCVCERFLLYVVVWACVCFEACLRNIVRVWQSYLSFSIIYSAH